jgi:hypothetical protein
MVGKTKRRQGLIHPFVAAHLAREPEFMHPGDVNFPTDAAIVQTNRGSCRRKQVAVNHTRESKKGNTVLYIHNTLGGTDGVQENTAH